jgi:cyclopropane fatty-acyl-phospholipid synthase-like methyltransferase
MKIWPLAKIRRVIKNFLKDPIPYGKSSIKMLSSLIQDKSLGIKACAYYFPQDTLSFVNDGSAYAATSHSKLRKMIRCLDLNPDDTFVDLGCGAGRAVFVAAKQRIKKAIGVEIRKELVFAARVNLKKAKSNRTPVEIIDSDAIVFEAKEGTVFFMFNPFGKMTFEKVINNIRQSLLTNPRKIRIAYYCPAYKDLLNAQDWLVFKGEIEKSEIFLWQSKEINAPVEVKDIGGSK